MRHWKLATRLLSQLSVEDRDLEVLNVKGAEGSVSSGLSPGLDVAVSHFHLIGLLTPVFRVGSLAQVGT